MRLVLPTMARTFWFWIRSTAFAATCCGSVCSWSTMYWIGRPLMPPLSFTQLKKAWAIPVIGVKSTPGCLVTIAPSLMGVPLALLPFPSPHFDGATPPLELEVPLLMEAPPQAPTRTTKLTASASSAAPRHGFSLLTSVLNCLLLPPHGACQRRSFAGAECRAVSSASAQIVGRHCNHAGRVAAASEF